MPAEAPKPTDDHTKANTGDVREQFSRQRPEDGKAGEPYGDQTETRDGRIDPETPEGEGLSNERYVKSDSSHPKVNQGSPS